MSDRKIAVNAALAGEGEAMEVACTLVLEDAEGAPLPRQYIADWFARDVDAAVEYERQLQPIFLNSADAVEERSAFFEKRAPHFKGL